MTTITTSQRALRLKSHDGAEVILTREAAKLLACTQTRELALTFHEGDQLTADLPGVTPEATAHLDADGLAPIGFQVSPGMILVGRLARPLVKPDETEETLGELFGAPPGRDGSLRCPPGLEGRVDFIERKAGAGKDDPPSVVVRVTTEAPLLPGDVLLLDGRCAVVGEVDAPLDDADVLWPGVSGEHVLQRLGPTATEVSHARSIGPYSVVTAQPLRGKQQFGGQELRPAEVEALLERGARHTVHELLTVKSDDVAGRVALYESIVLDRPECTPTLPHAAQRIERLLRAVGFNVDFSERELALSLLSDAEIAAQMPGVVTKPETINYRTLRPEKGGLFCEEIFGKVGSPERHAWMGRVELAVPVLHPWAREAAARLLGVTPARLKAVVLHETTLTGEEPTQLEDTGARALKAALAKVDLEHPHAGAESLCAAFRQARQSPARLCFTRWPVSPPELRPLVPLDDGRFATSDLNDLYRRLINRNNRTRRLLELNAPEIIIRNESRMLQEALDSLVENGTDGRTIVGPDDRALMSILDMLAGERGQLARAVHKHVDYSGVARAVPRSGLGGTRALLSRTMALELFKPWIYAALERDGHVARIKEAKRLVEQRDVRALHALEQLVAAHPLLVLNEAATTEPAVLGVQVMLWDAPGFGLSRAAFEHLGLSAGGNVVVHVPVDPAALDEVRALSLDRPRTPLPEQAHGWLTQATGLAKPAPFLMHAALHFEVDPVKDRVSKLMLGRLTDC